MTTLEFGLAAIEYTETHAASLDEAKSLLNFALFLADRYADKPFTFDPNDLSKLVTRDEKDTLPDKKIECNCSKLIGDENVNANIDKFMQYVRRYYYYLEEYDFKIIDKVLHDFALELVYCHASSENELQDFINSYYDSTGALRYSNLGSTVYKILSKFARDMLM